MDTKTEGTVAALSYAEDAVNIRWCLLDEAKREIAEAFGDRGLKADVQVIRCNLTDPEDAEAVISAVSSIPTETGDFDIRMDIDLRRCRIASVDDWADAIHDAAAEASLNAGVPHEEWPSQLDLDTAIDYIEERAIKRVAPLVVEARLQLDTSRKLYDKLAEIEGRGWNMPDPADRRPASGRVRR